MKNLSPPKKQNSRAYLSELKPGRLEAPHLQPLLEEVEGIRDGFADHSGAAATQQDPHATFTGVKKKKKNQ